MLNAKALEAALGDYCYDWKAHVKRATASTGLRGMFARQTKAAAAERNKSEDTTTAPPTAPPTAAATATATDEVEVIDVTAEHSQGHTTAESTVAASTALGSAEKRKRKRHDDQSSPSKKQTGKAAAATKSLFSYFQKK